MKEILSLFIIAAMQLLSVTAVFADGEVTDRSLVCMMQDSVLKKPGIPLTHEGKTYYSCCPMCKERMIAEPAKYLFAEDPVTKKKINKADALVYELQGTAIYFESKSSLQQFAVNPKQYLLAAR